MQHTRSGRKEFSFATSLQEAIHTQRNTRNTVHKVDSRRPAKFNIYFRQNDVRSEGWKAHEYLDRLRGTRIVRSRFYFTTTIQHAAYQGLFGALLGLFGVAYLTHKNPKMINTATTATPMPSQSSPRTFNLSRPISRRANAPSGGSHAAWIMMSCRWICLGLQLASFPTLSLL
ncbi:hypothetical protein DBV15_03198 [Temnothorax longispinosus]|uniref:Uncharacterized protein n=1 Tax=Temnothorax longispinosus TaxID=300112 RepID=A0A4S2L404_9HYME|nr:hypothetical protein DBV15_03198 [Temnothorax longispinosus]